MISLLEKSKVLSPGTHGMQYSTGSEPSSPSNPLAEKPGPFKDHMKGPANPVVLMNPDVMFPMKMIGSACALPVASPTTRAVMIPSRLHICPPGATINRRS